MTELLPRAGHRDDRRPAARAPYTMGGIQALHLRAAVLPVAAMAVIGAVVVAVLLLAGNPSPAVTWVVVGCFAAGGAAALGAGAYAAVTLNRKLLEQVSALRSLSSQSREELQALADRVQRGERPPPTRSPCS
jgi:hypothetical protein